MFSLKKTQSPKKAAQLFNYLEKQGFHDWELWDMSSKVASVSGKLLETKYNFFLKEKHYDEAKKV